MSEDGGLLAPRRRLLGEGQRTTSSVAPAITGASARTLTQAERQARRQRRDPAILAAVRRLDVAPDLISQTAIIDWLHEAYEARGGGVLIGLFGHCYLGSPYVDHAFDLSGQILCHYTPAETVPVVYVPARPLALSEAYAYIEIYGDGQIVPVRPDGSPAV